MSDDVPVWKLYAGDDTFAYALRNDKELSLGGAHAAIVSRAEWDVIRVMGSPALLGHWYYTNVDIGRRIGNAEAL